MFESRDTRKEFQPQFRIGARRVAKATPSTFYRKLDATLESISFTAGVREICRPAYADAAKGRCPVIDPAVYFKMLMIGFFENVPSERSIANRCADSLSLRAFLGYGLEDETPDHSSLSVIRSGRGTEIFQAALELVLRAPHGHGLIKGRNLGIDSSVIEAKASLQELVHRNTDESYWDCVRRLAAEAGIDQDDIKAVRRFDRNHEWRKTSNQEWVNAHDPDAKVGMTQHGAYDMIYKPWHITDLDTGVIVAAEVCCGDEVDTVGLSELVLAAGEVLSRVCEDPDQTKVLKSLTADKGYFAVEETCCLQMERVRVIIGDLHESKRKPNKQNAAVRQVLRKAKQAVGSESGRALLPERGEHLERSFCNVLDHGKDRQATLPGRKNLTKRQLAADFTHNLSVLMRHLTGHGTPKQCLAAGAGVLFGVIAALLATLALVVTGRTWKLRRYRFDQPEIVGIVLRMVSRLNVTDESGIRRFSTGC